MKHKKWSGMRPLQTDLSIFNKFKFEYPPVGIKYLFNKPEGIERLDKSLALCEMLKEAQLRKTPFYIAKENEDCNGKDVLGMTAEKPLFARSGQVGYRAEQFQEPRANMLMVTRQNPTLSKGSVNYVVFSPLDKLAFEPDLLVFLADTRQTDILLRSTAYSTGERYESITTMVLSCSWIFVYPFLSGKVNYLATGLGEGTVGRQVFPEGRFLISVPFNVLPTVAQNLKEMKWVLPKHSLGRDKYIKWGKEIEEQLNKEARNT